MELRVLPARLTLPTLSSPHSTLHRVIQTYMIDMENLLNLLDKRAVVKDKPDARTLAVATGEVVYDNVTFG